MREKIIVVLGPTASGKSSLAITLAKKFNGEIISADSRQVYKGLDIGTGKVTTDEMAGIPHHLLDVADPKHRYTVVRYVEQAKQAIEEIVKRGHTPIVCGGTGFYIEALVTGTVLPDVPPNPKLRKKLSALSKEKLFQMLAKLDARRAKAIDQGNARRIIRAIEISQALGAVPKVKKRSDSRYDFYQIGIKTEPSVLKEKIRTRLFSSIDDGMIHEAEKRHRRDPVALAAHRGRAGESEQGSARRRREVPRRGAQGPLRSVYQVQAGARR